MSTSTAVHSNAFNFMSFLQSGVDPRTGQYTVSLTLPEVEANALLGPALNLALFFNPLNTQDSGYGKGWNLQLSQFDPGNQVVALHTGESFQAKEPVGTELFMDEKKLDSFKLYRKTEPGTEAYYEVRHRSGLIEKLQRLEASRPLYLPAQIRTAQTRPLKLAYTPFIETSGKRAQFVELSKGHCQYTLTELFNQTHYRLASIQGADADGNYLDLLTVERTTTALTITLNPAGAPQQQAVFVLQLDGEGKVTELQLPSVGGNQGKWRFRYESHHGHDCLTEVRTPTGAWELIEYDPEGHGFSNGISGRLPRVARHEIRPGDKDGPAAANKPCNQVFTYSYALTTGDADYQAGNNFLGANLPLGDPDPTPGLDILYRHSGSYRYGSVEQLLAADGSVARTLERQFNKFHLLAWEQERQGPDDDQHLRTVLTTYSYDPAKPFKDQRADCQLPQDTTTRWRKRSSGDERQEVIKRTYHDDGNLHTEEQPNGVIETSLWYPSTGEGSDCPADPDGFARHLKSKTTTPGPGAQAPTLRTRYRYRTLAALPGNTQDQSWHVVDEELLEQMTGEQASTLQSIQHTYYDDSNDAFIHGRLHSQALTMNGLTTMTRYAYALGTATGFGSDQAEQTVLSIEQTVMGHEYDPDNEALKGVYKITRSERSLLTGEPLLSEDEEGTKMHFVYDVLGRLVSETVAPTTQYAATRTYSYTLCAVDRDRAQQQLTTSHGVTMITYLDGLTRLVREARDHIDDTSDATRKQAFDIRHIEYDTQGRQTTTTQFDYNGATRLTQLTQHSTYDHWGHQNCVTLPDGTQQHTDTELHGPGGYKGRIVQTWRQAAGKDGATSSKRKQWINLFDKPERTQRLGTAGTATEVERFEYDGLGQCVVQRDAYGYKTLNTYDAFGRVTQVRLPDNTRVLRDYAAHSPQTLAAAIRVMAVAPPGVAGTPVTLGTRVHDGVGRLKSTTAGMRTETLDYPAGKSLANRRTTAAARAVDLSYNPQLTDSPTAITVEDTYQSDFAFDDVRATLVSATNEHGQRRYAYDWNNRLKLEEWCVDGTCVFKREKQFSSAGRALLQTATGSLATQWQYDDHGRLHSVRQGAFSVNVSYDPLGRPNRFEVEQSGAATPVATTVISYDEHDREVSRTLKLERQAERTLQQTWGPGDLLRHRELMEGQTLLLQETFGYDERKRLTTLKYRGQKQPKDELGRTIKHQTFLYDPYDNIFYCRNEFANADAEHTLFLAAPDDPCQLKEIVYIPPRYKQPLPLSYTQDGHLQRDELGRTMIYDALGHLQQVTAEDALGRSNSTYRYDALGQLLATQHDANEETLLVFEENRLSFAIRGASKTQWLRALGTPFAQQTGDDILLLQTNANVSVISEATHDTRSDTSYLAYGGHYPLAQGASLLGFNGEYIDPATGWYLLGSGYRALNPKQLRFNSPDSMSPFDGGGLSCYGYANANPIAFNDPTGHSAQGIASASDYQQSSSAQGIELTSAYESEAQRYLRYQSMEFERQQQAAREKAKNDLFIKGGLSLLLSIASLGIGAVGSAPAFITLMNLIGTALNASSLAVSAAALTTSDEKLIRAADVMDYVSIGLGIVDLTSTFASLSKSPLIASKVAATAVAASRRSSSASLLSQPAATMQRRSSASGALSYMEASAPPEPSAPPGTSSRNLGGRPSISSVSGSGSARPSIIPSQIRSAESQA